MKTATLIKLNVSGVEHEFLGTLLAEMADMPYPDESDDFYAYYVYQRAEDNYFCCHNESYDKIKFVENEAQIVSFFGFDPIAKDLYDFLGIDPNIELTTHEDGEGDSIELVMRNDRNYTFVGKKIISKLLECGEILEVYALNTQGYISCISTRLGYTDLHSLDEQHLIEMSC